MTLAAFYLLFALGIAVGAAGTWWWIRDRIQPPPPSPEVRLTVTVDWNSIRQGMQQDDRIVVRPVIDWGFVARACEAEGYVITQVPRQ